EALEGQLAYWRRRLDGLETLDLPTDHVRPPAPTHRGGWISFDIDEELTARLRRVSREEGATMFMLLLAAFQVVLSRYAGQQDVAVGTVIANRGRRELEDLIGFFVNTLVLRTRVERRMTVRELLRRVREVTLEAYSHQDVPFEKVVEEIAPERDLS